MKNKLASLLDKVRAAKPLVHHITNYVTVNDCANITLGIGASPVMADAQSEAADIAALSNALVLNLGTLNERTVPSMLAAGKAANQKGIPVVLDPVGAGASPFRNQTAARLLDEINISVLRGNVSEIKFLAGLDAQTKGVDASECDRQSTDDTGQMAQGLARKLCCVVVVSGATDVVADSQRVIYIQNGHPLLGSLCGTGCMCSSLIGSFCGASPDQAFLAAAAAMACMGIAGEIAWQKTGKNGQGSFHSALRDAVSGMDGALLEGCVKYREA
jgi:hydroxyethylthiazole kinase